MIVGVLVIAAIIFMIFRGKKKTPPQPQPPEPEKPIPPQQKPEQKK